jgi:hypothetical protein
VLLVQSIADANGYNLDTLRSLSWLVIVLHIHVSSARKDIDGEAAMITLAILLTQSSDGTRVIIGAL